MDNKAFSELTGPTRAFLARPGFLEHYGQHFVRTFSVRELTDDDVAALEELGEAGLLVLRGNVAGGVIFRHGGCGRVMVSPSNELWRIITSGEANAPPRGLGLFI